MQRRFFLHTTLATSALPWLPSTAQGNARRRNAPFANDYVAVWKSPAPLTETGGPVSMTQLPGGRLVVTFTNWRRVDGKRVILDKVYTSDDRGQSWVHRADVPIVRQRVFRAGKALYMLGGRERLLITRSDDDGATWADPVPLTDDGPWGGEPVNEVYAHGRVYLVNERTTVADWRGWPAAVYAPVVMSARVDGDLTRRETWTFSNVLSFRDVRAKYGDPKLVGVPFYAEGFYAPDNKADKRPMYEIGWTEPNLVQIVDPEHVWHDPTGHTFHLLLRAHTGSTNLACLAKAVQTPDGRAITVDLEQAPSGEPILYLPFPGGQMRELRVPFQSPDVVDHQCSRREGLPGHLCLVRIDAHRHRQFLRQTFDDRNHPSQLLVGRHRF